MTLAGAISHPVGEGNKRILVIAAHPDDEVLGCGGTIARHVMDGDTVSVLILGEGATSRAPRRKVGQWKAELSALKHGVQQAAQVLGVTNVYTFRFPDNRFDEVPLLDIVKAVEEVKTKVAPTIVYTHHGGDLNIDHRITFNAVVTACRPLAGETVRSIHSFEVPSSTEWRAPTADGVFLPTEYIDIFDTLSKKLEAMACYASELREYPHPRSIRALELIARRNGIEVGMQAAERFSLVRRLT